MSYTDIEGWRKGEHRKMHLTYLLSRQGLKQRKKSKYKTLDRYQIVSNLYYS